MCTCTLDAVTTAQHSSPRRGHDWPESCCACCGSDGGGRKRDSRLCTSVAAVSVGVVAVPGHRHFLGRSIHLTTAAACSSKLQHRMNALRGRVCK